MVEPVALHACGFIGFRGERGRFGVDGNWRGGIEGRIKNRRVRQVGIFFYTGSTSAKIRTDRNCDLLCCTAVIDS